MIKLFFLVFSAAFLGIYSERLLFSILLPSLKLRKHYKEIIKTVRKVREHPGLLPGEELMLDNLIEFIDHMYKGKIKPSEEDFHRQVRKMEPILKRLDMDK